MSPTVEQRDRALRCANTVRLAKARLKAQLGGMPRWEACEEAARLCEEPDEIAGSLRVRELVESMNGYASAKTLAVCRRAGIVSADRRLRELTPRQRVALASVLRERSLLARNEDAA